MGLGLESQVIVGIGGAGESKKNDWYLVMLFGEPTWKESNSFIRKPDHLCG